MYSEWISTIEAGASRSSVVRWRARRRRSRGRRGASATATSSRTSTRRSCSSSRRLPSGRSSASRSRTSRWTSPPGASASACCARTWTGWCASTTRSSTRCSRPSGALRGAASPWARRYPGLTKLTWASKGVTDVFVKDVRKHCVGAAKLVGAFHLQALLAQMCRQIGALPLISLKKQVYPQDLEWSSASTTRPSASCAASTR